jgi:hypothetical protein
MRFAILLSLAAFSAPLFGQEQERVGHLYFTKTYRGTDPLPQVVTMATEIGTGFTASSRTSAGGSGCPFRQARSAALPAPLTVSVKPDLMLAEGNYSGQVVLPEAEADR